MKTDPKAKDVASRSLQNSHVINEAIRSWVMSQDSVKEAERLLEEAGVPCARVKEVVELATTDPQIEASDMNPTIFRPFLGPMHMYGTPLKFSETPASIRGYAPFLGEHDGKFWRSNSGIRPITSKVFTGKKSSIMPRKWKGFPTVETKRREFEKSVLNGPPNYFARPAHGMRASD